jgi:phosphoglycerol transferase MdoB-like AlkP superfamily enzyme
VLLLAFGCIVGNFFQMAFYTQGYAADLLAASLMGWWLYALLRPWWLYLLVQTLVTGLLYMSNAYKMRYFDAPVVPADLAALPVLLQQVAGWRLVLMGAPFLLLVLACLAGLRRSWRTPVVLLAGVLLVMAAFRLASGPISRGLDTLFGYQPFAAAENLAARGPTLYLVNEYARTRAVAGLLPSRDTVLNVLRQQGLPQPLPKATIAARRDVYVFMMETLWDPSLLQAVHFSRDPLAPGFRALWRQAGESKAMVPVFGGGTPNSEFEVLCGIPAYTDAIVFITTLHRPMMCLPRILAGLGYRTDAATPDSYGEWNRGDAFRLLGFQRFY